RKGRPHLIFRQLPDETALALHAHADPITAVCEDETGDFVRKRVLVGSNEDSADRRADEQIRPLFPGGPQERVEIPDRLLDGLVRGSGITPSEPGPIVGANPSALCDFRLYESPVDGIRVPARHQDDGWTTLAGTQEVELAAANVDQSAGGRVSLR